MRLDKFLKVSRLIKRRTVAKEVALHDRIMVNSKLAKPSTTLKIDDIITLTFGNKQLTVRVMNLNTNANKLESSFMYKVIDESTIND
ncbi:MAG: RNA-binding S4 domain-containing protein [Anaeroplasmataceae bacterium]